jgi:hypothetical protein
MFQLSVLPWALTPVFLIVAGVLLWRGHTRQYFAGVIAWGMVIVLCASRLMNAWAIVERGRHVLFEQWAIPVTLLVFSVIAVAYLLSVERRSDRRVVHAV